MSSTLVDASDDVASFVQRKQQIADELKRGRDLSPKGSLDAPIVGLIDFINSLFGYYTTSSCSGRISIFQHLKNRTKGGDWLLINHDQVSWEEVSEALKQIQTDVQQESAGEVILRFEPFILAVECRSLSHATQFLSVALGCGFRESGLSSIQRRFILSVRSSVRLEVPIWTPKKGGEMLVQEGYLRFLLDTANAKHIKNLAKIERFDRAVRLEFGDVSQTAIVNEKPSSKFYNPFESESNKAALASSGGVSSSSAGGKKSKLSPHALHGRQERLLQGIETIEQRMEKIKENIQRVKKGEAIVTMVDEAKEAKKKKPATTTTTPKPRHTKPATSAAAPTSAQPNGNARVAPKASVPAIAAPSSSPSASSPLPPSSSPLSHALFVPRSQTKIVKDACTAHRWLDVRYKIVPSNLPESLRSFAAPSPSDTQQPSWMRIIIDANGAEQIQQAMKHVKKSFVQADVIKMLLEIPPTEQVDILHAMVRLEEPTTVTKPNTKAGVAASAASSPSSSSIASPSALPSTAPPRVRLLHALHGVASEYGLTPSRIDSLVPTKWEKLGDDMIIWPAGSWKDDMWNQMKTRGQEDGSIPKLWQLVMSSFKGIHRIALSHEVALADVLRTSQVELLVTGREADHPVHALIMARPDDERDGWVIHKENGVLYHFDVTKVMFSSGNGTEKKRIVETVLHENIAERFGETDGETFVDLYAGIGYFTIPLLVHTATTTTTTTTTATPAAASPSSNTSGAASKLRFLYACELNPHSLVSLRKNIVLNHISPSRVTVCGGDNRTPEIWHPLVEKADRISLGLLPSSEDTWPIALKVLKSRGGVLHVHANLPEAQQETFAQSLVSSLRSILSKDETLRTSMKSQWHIKVFRMTHVKNYAPRIGHFVADVACFPRESPWWTAQEQADKKVDENNNNTAATTTNSTDKKKVTLNKTVKHDVIAPPNSNATSSSTLSSDPSLWYPYPHDLPVEISPSYERFRTIVSGQVPVVLRGLDLGSSWRTSFTPEGILSLTSRSPTSSNFNPLVNVHVAPSSSRMDFLNRNYMFKQMRLKELIERMIRIGRDEQPHPTTPAATSSDTNNKTNIETSTSTRSPETPKLASSSSSSSITRDSYFISPFELYYLRSLGSNPKLEVANFWSSFPELASKISLPKNQEGVELLERQRIFSSIFRISSPGLQLWTHYDVTDNLLLHLHGLKRVVLFPPNESEGLALKHEPDSSSSPILNIDTNMNPALPSQWSSAQASGRQVILLPGDVLFIPALWFHNVTSLNTKFVEGYHTLINDPSLSIEDLRSYGDICISLNLFWKELNDSEYQLKDLYGNKDLKKGVEILVHAREIANQIQTLPKQYGQFYATRAHAIIDTPTTTTTTTANTKTN